MSLIFSALNGLFLFLSNQIITNNRWIFWEMDLKILLLFLDQEGAIRML